MMEQFGAFTASELYCPKCQRAQPVRERLLLVLPSGELHEYICAHCSHSLATRTTTAPPSMPRPARRPAGPGRRVLTR